MRCINFNVETGVISGFTLVSYPLESYQIVIDMDLYEELLKMPYKLKYPNRVLNRVYTKNDLPLFDVVPNPNKIIGKDSSTLNLDEINESISLMQRDLGMTFNKSHENGIELQKQDKVNQIQNNDITVTQDALDFLLFQTFGAIMEVSGNSKATRNGGDTMSAYFVSRIIKKGAISLEQGRSYYLQVKTQYPQLIEEIDFLLISEGREDLIVK